MHDIFPTNKSIVLKKLKKFCEEELINYTSKRNYDFGTPHKNVSTLSPYINRRFISESDVLRQATKNYDGKQKYLYVRVYYKHLIGI